MRSFLAFTRHEFAESVRTYRLLILGAVFLFIGISSPATARFMPEILRTAGLDPTALGLGAPSTIDSLAQYFKNAGQLGLFALAIVYSGIMAHDISQGTLIVLCTKGLKRTTIIFAKLCTATFVWTLVYLLSAGCAMGYTAYYFGLGGVQNVFLSYFTLWLFGVLLIAIEILGGVLFASVMGALMSVGAMVGALFLLTIFPALEKYNPISLVSKNVAIIARQLFAHDIYPAVGICIVCIALAVLLSIMVFNKKQL